MIGFINRGDIPRLIIAFIVGVVLLAVALSALEAFYPHGGNVAAVIGLAALVVIFGFSYWAGGFIWERIQARR